VQVLIRSLARPLRQDTVNRLPHQCAGVESFCAAHQKLIIICMLVSDVCDHREVHR
jgi:hypothetical protein